MRIYLNDEYVEEYKTYAGYLEEHNLIMLMSKKLDENRKSMFIEMFKNVEIDELDMALSMEEAGLPLDIHFTSEKGFDYAKFRVEELDEFLDTLVMYVSLNEGNNIYLMFQELGPIFTMVSPSILCKEFGDVIAFMVGEGVVDLEFCHEDDLQRGGGAEILL